MNLFEEEKNQSINFLKYLYDNRKRIILFVSIAVLLSVVVTLFIPKKYRSSAVVYPISNYSNKTVINAPEFGYERDAEHLLQLLYSSVIRDSVVEKFNLAKYYKLDTDEIEWKDKLVRKFVKDITFSRTKYLSVAITAITKDPQMSADIVNYILEIVNNYKKGIFKVNMQKEMAFLEEDYNMYKEKLDDITNKIYVYKDSSKVDEVIENALIKASKSYYVEDKFINTEYMAELLDEFKFTKYKFSTAKSKLEDAKQQMNKPFLDNYVIEYAEPSYLKESPSFVLNALIAFFLSFSIILVWLSFKYKMTDTTA